MWRSPQIFLELGPCGLELGDKQVPIAAETLRKRYAMHPAPRSVRQ